MMGGTIALSEDLSSIGFQDTERFELPVVRDGEAQELKEKAVKELKKTAIKQEIKTGAKPEWAGDVERAANEPGGQAPDPDAGQQHDDGQDPGGQAEDQDDHGSTADAGPGIAAAAGDNDTVGLLERFYDDLFNILAVWTGWPGFKNTPELNQLYARNTGYFIKKIDPRIIGFLMISVVTLGKILGFKEYREKQQASKAAGAGIVEKMREAAEKAGPQ